MSVLEVHKVKLHSSVVESIRAHARREREKGGYEAVGFVGMSGGSRVGTSTLPMNNHAVNPQEAFFVEPWEQYRAEQTLSKNGYHILGVYHSHPNSEALPSRQDNKWARANEFVFLYSVVFDDLKAYKESDGQLIPAVLKIESE